MDNKDIYAVISRHLTETASEVDKKKLKSWIEENVENEALFEMLKTHWNAPPSRKLSILKGDEIKKDIWERAINGKTHGIYPYKKKNINIFLRYAAVILILISAAFVIYIQFSRHSTEEHPVGLITKSNNAGRKSTIHLGDGTIVNLNSESQIAYHEIFSDTARIIWLTGEAYFDVARDTLKPFYVVAGDLKVQALGTSFNVYGYSDSDMVQVSLSKGKVSVGKFDPTTSSGLSEEIILNPGQQVSYKKSIDTFSPVTSYDVMEVEAWKEGILYFKEAGLEEVIGRLKRWYGVEISLASLPGHEISYTGIFEKQNLENVLTSIGFVADFEFEINDKNVVLTFKKENYE